MTTRRLDEPEVFINGEKIDKNFYEFEDGKVSFLKPLIELVAKKPEIDENGKPIFWIVVSYEVSS